MKRFLFTHTNFIPYFVVGKRIAMFSGLTLGTNRAMFTYLTPGINKELLLKHYSTKRHRHSTKRLISYNDEMRIIYVNFIKALLNNKFNLDKTKFKNYLEIIKFLEKFQGDKLFTQSHISNIKYKGKFEKVPLTPKCEKFIKYVKQTFPNFNSSNFALTKHAHNNVKTKTLNKLLTFIKVNILNKILLTFNQKITKLKIATFLKKVLLLDNIDEGITFLFIQLPYLIVILFILDNPDTFKDLFYDSENIDEYKTPYFWSDYTKDSGLITNSEYYIYSNPEVLDTENITHLTTDFKNTQNIIHSTTDFIDNKSKSKSESECKSNWWFPMLDFNNINYFPSLFDNNNNNNNFNNTTTYYIKDIDIKNYNKNNNNISIKDVTKYLFESTRDVTKNLLGYGKINTSQSMDIVNYYNSDSDSKAVTKFITNTKINIKPTSLYNGFIQDLKQNESFYSSSSLSNSDKSSTFSKYFYYATDSETNSTVVNKNLLETDLETSLETTSNAVSKFDTTSNVVSKIDTSSITVNKTETKTSEFFADNLHYNRLLSIVKDTLDFSEFNVKTPEITVDVINTQNTNVSEIWSMKKAIVDLDRRIIYIKQEYLDFHHKINLFDKEFSDLTYKKLYLEEHGINNLSFKDKDSLNSINEQLKYIEKTKTTVFKEANLKHSKIENLKIQKAVLLEVVNRYEEEHGNI